MEELYIALDFPDWNNAKDFLETNKLNGVGVKVGMELFYREGIHVIEQLKLRNHPIFLDLKLHDIPTTVMRAISNLASLEVDIVNVHALGGSEMIKQAKEGLQSGSKGIYNTKLIAVTILTSADQAVLNHDLGLEGEVSKHVNHFASLAKNSGADGVVCSVHEAEQIKQLCGKDFITVTPGIRLADSAADDQKRVATPKTARQKGTDVMVVGRSITKAEHPLEAYHQVLEEWKYGSKN